MSAPVDIAPDHRRAIGARAWRLFNAARERGLGPMTPDFGWNLGGDYDFAERLPPEAGRPGGRAHWPAVQYGRVAGVYDPRAYLRALRELGRGPWVPAVLDAVPDRGKLPEALWCWGVHPALRAYNRPAGLHGVASLARTLGEALGMGDSWTSAASELEELTRGQRKFVSPLDFASRKLR